MQRRQKAQWPANMHLQQERAPVAAGGEGEEAAFLVEGQAMHDLPERAHGRVVPAVAALVARCCLHQRFRVSQGRKWDILA